MEGVQNLPKSRKNPQNQPKYANICTKESKNTQKLSAFCRFCYIIVPRKARLARECGHRLHFYSSHLSFLCSFYIRFLCYIDFAQRILVLFIAGHIFTKGCKMDVKTWIFPTLCFFLFCYVMVFVGFFTYRVNPNVSLFQEKGIKGATSLDNLAKEMNKAMKK